MKHYAGIGSQSIPNDIFVMMREIGFYLAQEGWTLRSGAAAGSDFAFETGCDEAGGKKEIFLPWKGFNQHQSSLFTPTEESLTFAQKYHPNWGALNQAGQKLIARDGYQVLGLDLKTPVKMVICYTQDGLASGGTGQAMRIAKDKNIAIFNLKNPSERARIETKLENWKNQWNEHLKNA